MQCQYYERLNSLLDVIYEHEVDMGFSRGTLAAASGLHTSTVYKLAKRITEYPRFQTVCQLGLAVGMEVHLAEPRAKHNRRTA